MNTLEAPPQQVAVQHRDVGEANHPFRALGENREVQFVYEAGGAVAAAGTKNGADAWVVQLALQVVAAQLIGPGKLVGFGADGFAYYHLQAPATKGLDGESHFGRRDFAGRGYDGHALAGLEWRRSDGGSQRHLTRSLKEVKSKFRKD